MGMAGLFCAADIFKGDLAFLRFPLDSKRHSDL